MADSRAGATCSVSKPLGCSVLCIGCVAMVTWLQRWHFGSWSQWCYPFQPKQLCQKGGEGGQQLVSCFLPELLSWISHAIFISVYNPFQNISSLFWLCSANWPKGFVANAWEGRSYRIQHQLQELTACQDKESFLMGRVLLWWWWRSGKLSFIGLHLLCTPPRTVGK